MGEHGCGRARIGEGIVGTIQRHVVAGRDIAEPVRLETIRVEPTGHPQRAQWAIEGSPQCIVGRPVASGAEQESGIEPGIVSGHDGAADAAAELVEHVVESRGATQRRAGDVVNIGGPDALQWPAQPDEARPFVDHVAVALDGDEADLQDAVPAHGESGCLQVDHGEAG